MNLSKHVKRFLSATAVALGVFCVVLGVHETRWFEIVELKALDHLIRGHANPKQAHPDIVLVAIDESSLDAFGRWPWPRDRHGYIVRFLKQAGAKAVVFDVMFFEPDENAIEFDESFAQDVKAAGNVFLPLHFQGPKETVSTEYLAKARIAVEGDLSRAGGMLGPDLGLKLPLAGLAEGARGLGFINLTADSDGPTRRIPLIGRFGDAAVPHLSLAVAGNLLGIEKVVIQGDSLRVAERTVPLTPEGALLLNWHGPLEGTYPTYAVGHVLQSFAQIEKKERPVLDPA
ncbi:MAG: CHASE2 domain-containing protein, partial [Nitrospiraceae bacterium]